MYEQPTQRETLLSVNEVSRMLSVSGESVRQMARSGKLAYVRIGKLFRISKTSVDAILSECVAVVPVKRRSLGKITHYVGKR